MLKKSLDVEKTQTIQEIYFKFHGRFTNRFDLPKDTRVLRAQIGAQFFGMPTLHRTTIRDAGGDEEIAEEVSR